MQVTGNSKLWFLLLSFCLAISASAAEPGKKVISLEELSTMKQREPFTTFPLQTTNNQAVGLLTDIVFDQQTSRARFAVVHLFDQIRRGPTNQFTLVPWELLREHPSGEDLTVLATEEQLRGAPAFEPAKKPKSVDAGWGQQFYAYFKVEPQGSPDAAGGGGYQSQAGSGSGPQTPAPADAMGRGSIVQLVFMLAIVGGLLAMVIYRLRRRA